MKVGSKTDKVQLKYTVGMKGSFPCSIKIFDKPEALSENKTIPAAIFEDKVSSTGIVVFDRGVHERKIFEKLSEKEIQFVTRINPNARYHVLERLKISELPEQATILIHEDLIVNLKNGNEKWSQSKFRLLKATICQTNETICFVTNIENMTAYEIAKIYKQRWKIEELFKFLKQQLNLSHLVTRNENGIRVMIYMTLILSILLIAYKKLNNISSYKIAKIRFSNEIESEIVKQIVLLCDGNPQIMSHLFNDG
jgi:transposase